MVVLSNKIYIFCDLSLIIGNLLFGFPVHVVDSFYGLYLVDVKLRLMGNNPKLVTLDLSFSLCDLGAQFDD